MDPAELRHALNAEVSTFHRDNGLSEFKHTETIVKTEADLFGDARWREAMYGVDLEENEAAAAGQKLQGVNQEMDSAVLPGIFVYGSLRPDDDSGMPWTHAACDGMIGECRFRAVSLKDCMSTGQKAVVTSAKLFHDEYAVAVLKTDTAQEGRVVGWVLSHKDPQIFAEKLASYDAIEGFNRQTPEGGFYKRTVTSAYLENQVREGQQQQIGDPGDAVQVYMYHRTDPCLESPVPAGDWLARVR